MKRRLSQLRGLQAQPSFHLFTFSPFHLFIFSSFRLCITDCADYAKMWLKEAIHDTEKDELAVA